MYFGWAAPRQRKHTNYVHDDKCFPQNWESEQLNDFPNIHPTEIRINWTFFLYSAISTVTALSGPYFKMPKLWIIWSRCYPLMNSNTHTQTKHREENNLLNFWLNDRQGSKILAHKSDWFGNFSHSLFIVHWIQFTSRMAKHLRCYGKWMSICFL